MNINELASSILNDVQAGLPGLTSNLKLSIEQLEQEIIDERLAVIKEYYHKGLLPKDDLLVSINCLEVDCKPLANCKCNAKFTKSPNIAHVEIPQLVNDLGEDAIEYFGTINRDNPFKTYRTSAFSIHSKSRFIGRTPYIYIDKAINENGMHDCYIFNAPMIKTLSIQAVFKDPRQLEDFACCDTDSIFTSSAITNDVRRRLTEKKVRWYRQLAMPITPNDQTSK